jgi:endonuclease/exonuclease/phosphatase family metal-dependent hydrolase
MKLVALLLGLLTLAGAGEPTPAPVRIMTWNLQWFPGGRPGATKDDQDKHIVAVRETIRNLAPDILLLQEVGSEGALEEALRPLGPEWKVAVVSRFMQGGFLSGQQIAIASRIAPESAWSEPWATGWAGAPRGYAYASFVINGKRLAAYSVHLKSNIGDAQGNTSKREDAVEQLLAHIGAPGERVKAPDALVIAGDFNTDDPDSPGAQSPGERTFGLLKKAVFNWAFAGLDLKDRVTCPGHGRYPDACFDHFFTKGLGAPAATVAKVEGSDHLPVTVDVMVK